MVFNYLSQRLFFSAYGGKEAQLSPLFFVIMMSFFTLCANQMAHAQMARERSVEVSAVIQQNPEQIIFNWVADPAATDLN